MTAVQRLVPVRAFLLLCTRCGHWFYGPTQTTLYCSGCQDGQNLERARR